MDRKLKIVAGAAVVAATAGLAAMAAKKASAPSAVYYVTADGDGWIVGSEGAKQALSRHERKRDAVAAARELANSRAPSLLVIHKRDGEVQRTHEYQPA